MTAYRAGKTGDIHLFHLRAAWLVAWGHASHARASCRQRLLPRPQPRQRPATRCFTRTATSRPSSRPWGMPHQAIPIRVLAYCILPKHFHRRRSESLDAVAAQCTLGNSRLGVSLQLLQSLHVRRIVASRGFARQLPSVSLFSSLQRNSDSRGWGRKAKTPCRWGYKGGQLGNAGRAPRSTRQDTRILTS